MLTPIIFLPVYFAFGLEVQLPVVQSLMQLAVTF